MEINNVLATILEAAGALVVIAAAAGVIYKWILPIFRIRSDVDELKRSVERLEMKSSDDYKRQISMKDLLYTIGEAMLVQMHQTNHSDDEQKKREEIDNAYKKLQASLIRAGSEDLD